VNAHFQEYCKSNTWSHKHPEVERTRYKRKIANTRMENAGVRHTRFFMRAWEWSILRKKTHGVEHSPSKTRIRAYMRGSIKKK
jgi:hypothetical protein